MKLRNQRASAVVYAIAMLVLILDAKTALSGAKEGITLCLYTVIPSLFPFLFISGILCSTLVGLNIPILQPLGKLCGIPSGGEPLLLLGLVGGYPVGAQNITHAYNSGQIDKNTARRLLGFCNNAGPAFIFGLMSSLFKSPAAPWFLWVIHIISALAVGILLPGRQKLVCNLPRKNPPNAVKTLAGSIKTMAEICGWIIIFRIFLTVLQRWLLWLLPPHMAVILYGLTELTNGCISLFQYNAEGAKFVLASVFISFGGLCIAMQTMSVTNGLGTGYYFPGKILQTSISFFLCSVLQQLILPPNEIITIPAFAYITVGGIVLGLLFWFHYRKKVVEIPCFV